jgi:TRAP-type C4-dicarboxylate transport system permease small subunit
MERVLSKVKGLSRLLSIIAGIILTFMMCLTVADVILRGFRKPIVGTYELVTFCAILITGLSLPSTSWRRSHIYVDFLISRFSKFAKNIFSIITRLMGIWLFIMLGRNVILYGANLKKVGEVSNTLQLPFYPIIHVLGICCIIQCLVLLCDILKIFGGKYE